jgi:protein SCO1/2
VTKGKPVKIVSATRRAALIALAGLCCASSTGAREARLTLPPPGSYQLDHIQRVPAAVVLESDHFPHWLSTYTTGSITLLSFFYSYCRDPAGCPLAWDAFENLRESVKQRTDLHGKVRFVFISLDPARDTPDMLRGFARNYEADAAVAPWHFLTTYSSIFLEPLLRNMGEETAIDRTASSPDNIVFNHLLKVFLIDSEGWVREIYSNGTLDPAAIMGDIESLRLEAEKPEK